MKIYRGHIAQSGYVIGPLFVMEHHYQELSRETDDPKRELELLDEAVIMLKDRLRKTAEKEKKNAAIYAAGSLLLDEDEFVGAAGRFVTHNTCSAAYAVAQIGGQIARDFEQNDSLYIRERSADIRGMTMQLIRYILKEPERTLTEPSVVYADELTPGELATLDPDLVLALISRTGSPTSHISIMAGNVGIPYVFGGEIADAALTDGGTVVVDARSEEGTVIADPDAAALAEAEGNRKAYLAKQARLRRSGQKAQCRLKVYANIIGPKDIDALLAADADGVGLYRSEMLFFGYPEPPTEDEQYASYHEVLTAMKGRDVVIRTMDIGSEKTMQWLPLPPERNPALGMRGVRVSLAFEEVFQTQLRALLRAATEGNLRVMFPMITSKQDIDAVKKQVEKAAAALEKEHIPYRIPPLGVMVETPAAALIADELAKEVSFFSIGTNDLTQYTLAIDREVQELDAYCQPHHEALFRLIEMTVAGGRKQGIETTVCGELGADEVALERLIRAGVDEVSVAISNIMKTKAQAAAIEAKIDAEKQ